MAEVPPPTTQTDTGTPSVGNVTPAGSSQGTTFLAALGLPGTFKFPSLNALLASSVDTSLQSSSGNGGGPGTGSSVTQNGPLQAYAKKLLGVFGWSGQWSAFSSIVNAESGWNPSIQNTQGSGAYGIAQALGHGTAADQGSQSDAYGGYGLSTAQAKKANSGDGYLQLLWMMNYIKSRYGDPNAAWAYHLAHNSY
jgi:hypothetical protein